mmetsp:Transcript_5009/g.14372  ORF Transcript_5009/g.14372 Transcript_5009/m.14372 type:complete len:220 (+) Transcript_5009:286-945(+)
MVGVCVLSLFSLLFCLCKTHLNQVPLSRWFAATSTLLSLRRNACMTASLSNPIPVNCAMASSDGGGGGGGASNCAGGAAVPPPMPAIPIPIPGPSNPPASGTSLCCCRLFAPPEPGTPPRATPPLPPPTAPACLRLITMGRCPSSASAPPTVPKIPYTKSGISTLCKGNTGAEQMYPPTAPQTAGTRDAMPPEMMACRAKKYVIAFSEKSKPRAPKKRG